MISDNEGVAIIDFDKYNSYLIDDIEKQLEIDLCDDSRFIAQSNINGVDIKFPSFAIKKCDYPAFGHGIVTIQINSDNEALVDNEFVSADADVKFKVLKATNEWMKNKHRKRLTYLITWDSLTNPVDIKNKVEQTLFAIKTYNDSLAISKFNKKTINLNLEESKALKEEFDFTIGFSGYQIPIPPPPPGLSDLE